jgi:hypothetical protein
MRRLFVLVLLVMVAATTLSAPSAAAATAPPGSSDSTTAPTDAAPTTTIDNSFLDTERQLSECLNNSVELPGCGRAPTNEGERGGALQLATFLVLALGIAFIFWRVARGIKARDAALAAKVR